MIDGDLFTFDTPLEITFDEFYRLSRMDDDLFTYKVRIPGLSYPSFDEPRYNGVPYEMIKLYCVPFCFKSGNVEWPTCCSKNNGYCDGGDLLGILRDKSMVYFQDYEWYEALEDGKLKDEALMKKSNSKNLRTIVRLMANGMISSMLITKGPMRQIKDEKELMKYYDTDNLYDQLISNNEYYCEEVEQYKEKRCELLSNPHENLPMYKIERLEVIKYSFEPGEGFVAIKECGYDD
nr:hypothetical protein [Tanacetum cinerariifolium]